MYVFRGRGPVVVYPLPLPFLVGGGESDVPACGPTVSIHKSRGNNVVCMHVQLKR